MSKPGPLQSDEIYLGNYLLTRLAQLGVKPIYGVPGDFNVSLTTPLTLVLSPLLTLSIPSTPIEAHFPRFSRRPSFRRIDRML